MNPGQGRFLFTVPYDLIYDQDRDLSFCINNSYSFVKSPLDGVSRCCRETSNIERCRFILRFMYNYVLVDEGGTDSKESTEPVRFRNFVMPIVTN